MGIFSDRCENSECRARVKKGAEFCSRCGMAAPQGMTRCGSCGSEVARTSQFCWRCGSDLGETATPILADDRWVRHAGDFAARFDNQDIKGWLTKPLVIEHGTKAMLFQGGKFKGELRDGSYDMGGFLKTLNHFMIDQDTSVVLIEAGDVTIDLESDDLWTKEKFQVGLTQRLVLRIADPDAMYVNIFKGSSRLTLESLRAELADEIQMLLSGIVAGLEAQRLFSDLAVRDEIEKALRESLAFTLGRLGLELIHLRFISFTGEMYEQLCSESGEVQLAVERASLEARLRETMTKDKMDSFKSEADFKEFATQTAHEMGMKDVIRDGELQRLREKLEAEALLHKLDSDGLTQEHNREQKKKDADTELDINQDKAAAGMDNLERMVEIQDNRKTLKQQQEAQQLEDRGKATAEALISILDGPTGERIAKLEEARIQKELSPEQILAMVARDNPEAARALAKKYEADGLASAELVGQMQSQLASQEKTAEAHADRLERMGQVAMEQMGHVAGVRARPADVPQTVVTGGSAVTPVVVNPDRAGQAMCKFCKSQLELGGDFCPSCGKKQ